MDRDETTREAVERLKAALAYYEKSPGYLENGLAMVGMFGLVALVCEKLLDEV